MKHIRAARTDENQKCIVQALRQAGCRVRSLAAVGDGCADLLVYRPAIEKLFLLEVKDGNKPPSRRRLTPDQKKFHSEFPVSVVINTESALAAVGIPIHP